jgi:hypothetical protein
VELIGFGMTECIVQKWFRRLGDIPGIRYATPEQIDRSSLAGCEDVPEVSTYEFDGQLRETLWWPSGDGSRGGSASPAHCRAFWDMRGLSATELVRNVYECLELPGEPSDYHFLIQSTSDALWRRRRDEPDLLGEVERLCWLDIELIKAQPDAASDVIDGQRRFYSITGFWLLIQLYEDRRDLTSALKVAEIAAAHGQCEDARERLLWQVGARETEPAPTPIQQPPQHPNGAQPTVVSSGRISDWGYRSGEADGPFAGSWSHQYSWWNDWCQGRFGELWTDEADRVADNLADEYWFYWPWLIGRALITGAPETYGRILDFAKDVNRPGPAHIELNPHAISDEIAQIGAFRVVRRRRRWPEPSDAICPTCGQDFWNGDVRVWAIQAFGPVRYCMDCCYGIRNGDPRATWFEHEVKAALQELRAAFGAIPAQSFSAGRVPHDGPLEERDRRIRALLAMPSVETIKRVLRQQDWLGVLRAAGLVGDGWRPSRGTWCHASDGHRCRSLLEKAIDDWFTASGISHQCEPRWPRHPDLNPSGAKRADWLLQDGTYVECAGMLESKDYAEKIALKQRLARTLGIPLIVVAPTDMHRLGQIFGRQLGSDRPVLST